ncbi:hypothetical protein FJZ36_00910 [Candidatus Poribacteria bacterium]|nr:hypothetical protein [Candidatus Poribacteria bacterium]
MRRIATFVSSLALLASLSSVSVAQPYVDSFDDTKLNAMWTFRNAGNNDKWEVKGGWFIFDIQANQDLFRQGVDGAPFLLMNPPADDKKFTIETNVDALLDKAAQPGASHAGLIIFREDKWAYSLWGPYNNQDMRLEDCIAADYRWRDQAQIAVDAKPDKDVYLQIVKSGTELEFFYKDSPADKWKSAGIDKKLGPNYEKGTYKIGLFLKNWGGSVAQKAAFDYFHSPELATAVRPDGKTASTWAGLKSQ